MISERHQLDSRRSHPLLFHTAGMGLVLLCAVAAFIFWGRRRQADALERQARQHAAAIGPRVVATKVTATTAGRTLTLPGDVRAFRQSTLYAKVSGYLQAIKVDKGDSVRENQVLGILESPETDQQVRSAQADLAIKLQTQERFRPLVKPGIVSQQEMDKADADVNIAKAELARLQALKSYETIRAPFDGTITARYVDQGALLPAATSSSAQPLVEVTDMSKLRIYTYPGQYDAQFIREGDAVSLVSDAHPESKRQASVTRITREIDPRTRTMLVEIDVDNKDRALYPGTFIHVAIKIASPASLIVPGDAIFVQHGETYVAKIVDSRASFVPVQTGEHDGKTVRILSGLAEGDIVGLHVGGEVADGAPVQAVFEEARGKR